MGTVPFPHFLSLPRTAKGWQEAKSFEMGTVPFSQRRKGTVPIPHPTLRAPDSDRAILAYRAGSAAAELTRRPSGAARLRGTIDAVTTPPLACTVRGCGLLLERTGRSMRCARGHSYDIARSGYVNLLQPQDKRARLAGDSREAVAARARLLARGIGTGILESCARRAAALDLPANPVVVDLGSGTGDLLAALAQMRPIIGIGIDLSTDAADYAARKHPDLTWVVANADRTLPLLDRTVDLVVSIHGRRNPQECARVLTPGGFVLVAVPAPDDLIALRRAVLGRAVERDRVSSLLPEYEQEFEQVDRAVARERQHLDRGGIEDLLRISYRGARTSRLEHLQSLEELEVTLASEILIFRRVEQERRVGRI